MRTDHAAVPPPSAGHLQQTQLSSFHTRMNLTREQSAPRYTAVPASSPSRSPATTATPTAAAAHWTRGSPQSQDRKRR